MGRTESNGGCHLSCSDHAIKFAMINIGVPMRGLLTFAIILLTVSAHSVSARWAFIEKDVKGVPLVYAEETGKSGGVLRMVCSGREFHIQMAMPANVRANHTELMFQVDLKKVKHISGTIIKNASGVPIFVGKDWRGEPAGSTDRLLRDMLNGSIISVVDPRNGAHIDSFELKSTNWAVGKARRKCP